MYNGKKILAIIPARGGSKGIPHKNLIDLCGIPLVGYTIEAGRKSRYIDYVMVSTDDEKIAAVARKYGAEVPFMRPLELASDTSKTIEAVMHTVEELKTMGMEFDTLVLLQPTQPLRTYEDIDHALEKYFNEGAVSLASISLVDDHPLLIRTVENGEMESLLDLSSTCRRQDMPAYYRVNGAIYINQIKNLDLNTSFNDNKLPYIMDKSHSVDIDEYSDLYMAKYYLENQEH